MEEDFDIDSLASYLHLNPDQVRKMANRGRLPGRRVGGDWRFSHAEIHHWLEEKIGVSDNEQLIEVQRVLDQQQQTIRSSSAEIDIPQLLSVDRICIPLNARTKNSVIDRMCEFAADSGALWSPKEMAEAIRRREELHPTALENGVALLHPRRPQPGFFGEPFLALGITSSGIPFGGPRGCLTDVFFLIASSDESFHLRVLARLSRLIHITDFIENLRVAGDNAVAWQLVADADNSI
jgi:PTS system nitrogen regulatory IIA component